MVVLESRTTNIRIVFRFDDTTKCWSVLTKASKERLMQIIENMDPPWDLGGERVKIIITDERQKNKSRTLFTKLSHEQVVDIVKEQLNNKVWLFDIKGARYKFVLRNNMTKTSDSKTVTFYAHGTFDEIFDDVDEIVQATIERELTSNVVFADEKLKYGTHIWCLSDVTTGMQRCKTVKIDGYSSEELMTKIQDTSRVIDHG